MSFAKNVWPGLLALAAVATTANAPALAQQPQNPNILVIMGDDIGSFSVEQAMEKLRLPTSSN